MKNQLTLIVSQLLKGNNISFDKKELEFQIQSHPSYPSLHAITGVLNHFNIENVAAQVLLNADVLSELPDCFVAQINDTNGQNLVTVRKKDVNYILYDGVKKNITLLKEAFIEQFTGILVAVEKNDEKVYLKPIINFNKIVFLVFLTVLSSYLFYGFTSSLFTYLHIFLSMLGVIISVAIIKQEIGLQTTIGNAFCSGADEKKDCDAVLTSKGAEIIQGYKLSDFSLLYFSTLLLATLVLSKNPSLVFNISLLAIPITIYSIYYQHAVIKKWCLLCLTIVGVLWLQIGVVLYSQNFSLTIIYNDVIFLVFILSIVTFLWSILKPYILEIHTLRKEKIKATKFQRNFKLFEILLEKSSSLNTKINDTNEIIFGNTKAKLELVVITNPFCGHCKPIHQIVEDIVSKYNTEVKIIVRFNVNPTNIESDTLKITTRLLEIYKEDKNKCFGAMSAIYEGMSVKTWLTKWGNSNKKEKFVATLTKEKKWCTDNNINFTPEILINGKPYPKEYNKSDLVYFMEDLIENVTVI